MSRWLEYGCWLVASLVCLGGSASAQVFTQDAGAVVGYTAEGAGQGLYGGFGLNSATAAEFNIYRKFTERANQTPQAVATNVDGNLGEINWSGINQLAGADQGITAPGMFIGTTNHTNADGWVTSNPNELLYFKGQFDNTGTATTTDSNKRTNWDTRFGFMETPGDYIDFAEPNSPQMDLWTGQYNTDAVYTQILIRGDDSVSDNITQQHNRGGSFLLQSGSDFTDINDERDRSNYPLMRVRAGSGEELEQAGFLDAGVAYDDAVEVSWGMRLNDPENSDAVLAREVEFWVKTGNIIASGVFDPSDMDDPAFDVPNMNDPEPFTDEHFNWREAIPVFFAGGQGNIGDGTGTMGMFVRGDFGADGSVNVDDFMRLASNFGDQGTTYSRGDLTQDGITDAADAMAWVGLASVSVRSNALAALTADVGGTSFDFDGNGITDVSDVAFAAELFGSVGGGCVIGEPAGDFDGNGTVAFPDFLILSANFGNAVNSYNLGDADCSGRVEFPDFLILSSNFGTTAGAAASVPEPTSLVLLLCGGLSVGMVRHRRRKVDP